MNSDARLAVVYRPLAGLVPYARNARTHSDEQVAQIAASIESFGWTNPILVDERGGVIAGHGRIMAAHSLGMHDVPTILVPNLSESQRRALVLADNKLALNAGWDFTILRDELAELDTGEFDISVIGFSDAELEQIATWTPDGLRPGRTDPETAPEPPVVPVSRPGDLWLLGRHRLLCGDATSKADVDRLIDGDVPWLMVTDPPYGVEYNAGWRNDAMPQKNDPARWKDGEGRAIGKVVNDDRADWREAWALFQGDVVYIWHGATKANVVADSLIASGFDIRAQIVWAKNQFVISRGHYHGQHEPCWYAVRKGGSGRWNGDRTQSTLWQIDKPHKSETGHSTQKPIECMRRPIENNSGPGDGVYDPFVGSGTTIIAAEQTGRVCYAMEIAPQYADVCVNRWQEFTGAEAVHNDGRSFAEIAGDRNKLREAA